MGNDPRFSYEAIRERATLGPVARLSQGLPQADTDIIRLLAEIKELTTEPRTAHDPSPAEQRLLDRRGGNNGV